MKKLLIISILSCNLTAFAAQTAQNQAITEKLDEATAERLVNAIFRIENSKKYPYGIKSIQIKGNTQEERELYSRRICLNTVVNNHQRWLKAGKPGSYLDYLGGKYCPISADPKGHRNWLVNIRKVSGLDF